MWIYLGRTTFFVEYAFSVEIVSEYSTTSAHENEVPDNGWLAAFLALLVPAAPVKDQDPTMATDIVDVVVIAHCE